MKNKTTSQPMFNPTTVEGIYTCLNMLVIEREDLHAWWCNLLYMDNGDINYPAWSEHTLGVLENDVAYYA
jgi:hypothetical protein